MEELKELQKLENSYYLKVYPDFDEKRNPGLFTTQRNGTKTIGPG